MQPSPSSASHTEYVFNVNSSRVGLGTGGRVTHSLQRLQPLGRDLYTFLSGLSLCSTTLCVTYPPSSNFANSG